MLRRQRCWIYGLVLLLATVCSMFGQLGTGTITGTALDPNAALIPNADVKLTNLENGAARDTKTSSSGEFRFDGVLPGEYKIELKREGFKTFLLDHIVLQSSEARGLGDLKMQLGNLADTISVTAEVTPVQTASSERSQTVTSDQLQLVTLKGRDPFGYLRLLPGVIDTNNDRAMTTNGSAGGISINGMDAAHVQPAMDGAPTAHMACNSCWNFVIPNVDAIAEVNVLANGVQAENGRIAGGGIVNFITKSGTTQFHGTAHWDHRNEDLNANSFFNNRTNVTRPIYRYMILGGSIGGPAYIPRLMPKSLKNKFFFFFSPEFTNQKQPTSNAIVNLPTVRERGGDFSQTFYASGAAPTVPILVVIKDPSTGLQYVNNGIPNVIPPSSLTALGQAFLNQLPLPNGYVNPVTPYAANSIFPTTPKSYRLDAVARVDANLSSKVTAFYRWGRDYNKTTTGNQVTAGVGEIVQQNPGRTQVGHVTYVMNPTTLLEIQATEGFTYGYFPGHVGGDTPYFRSADFNPPKLFSIPTNVNSFNGYSQHFGFPLYLPWLPAVSYAGGNYAGYTSWNPNNVYAQAAAGDNQYTVRGDLSKIWRSHAFKLGYYWEHSSDFDGQSPGSNYPGSFNFGSSTSNPLDTGNGYANALVGVFTNYSESNVRGFQARHFTLSNWYLQDNWKVTSRLVLDIGVRFYHQSPTYDDSKLSAMFVPSTYTLANAPRLYYPACRVPGATCSAANQYALDRVTGATAISNFINKLVPGVGSAADGVMYPNPYGLSYPAVGVQPRFGFAYSIGEKAKTVIRGSAGIFQNTPNLNNLGGLGNYPVSYNPTIYYSTMTQLAQSSGSIAQVIPASGESVFTKQPLEVIYQFNFVVERALPFDMVATVAYLGNLDRHGALGGGFGGGLTLNNVPLGSYALSQNLFNGSPINADLLRAEYPGMGSISEPENAQSLVNYHSLQTSLKRRLTRGLTFTGTYSFSKSLGTQGWDVYHTGMPITTAFGTTVTLPSQRDWYYGPTSQDRTHYGSANFVYMLPGPKGPEWSKLAKVALSNWTLSGVTNFSSGAPAAPSCSLGFGSSFPANDPTWTQAGGVRCQVVGNWKNFYQDFDNNFNTKAFAYPSAGTTAAPIITFGNTGLGIMRQPTWWNQDLTIAKDFPLGGENSQRRLQVNLQAYNVLNHTEFTSFGTAGSWNTAGVQLTSTYGQYTGTNQPRQMVVTAKFIF